MPPIGQRWSGCTSLLLLLLLCCKETETTGGFEQGQVAAAPDARSPCVAVPVVHKPIRMCCSSMCVVIMTRTGVV